LGSVVTSPSITVTPATFSVTWHYTTDGGTSYYDLQNPFTSPYNKNTYTISPKIITPLHASHTQSGTASVTNVADPAAQLTLTGSGNFTGVVTSPSITVTVATFTANWEYSDGGQYVSLPQGGLNPTYDQKTYTIRVEGGTTPIITPSYATYTGPTGTVSVTNVADGAAQLTLTGSGNFLGSVVTSPSITVTVATFSVTWHYTTDGISYNDLQTPFTSPYNQNTYTISPHIITPSYATHTQSGTASVTNAIDPAALITLTGSDNFVGSVVTSPSITVTVATFTVTTWKFTHNGTTSDLTNNLFFPPDGSPYTISFIPIPSDATYTPSGNASVTNVADGAAQLTLTGSGNYAGSSVVSPSITMVQNIYNQNGDGQSFSLQDPPTWSASGPYDPKVFGKFTVTGGEVAVLVQAETLYTVDGVNYLDSLTYDKNVPLYLYFYTSAFFYATADIVAHVTFPATPDDPALSTFIFPTPVTLSPSTTTTYFAIWSQILIPPDSPVPSQGGNPNLTMKITNNNDPNQIWQWLGTLSGTLS
jgi:hypothetical protein